MKQCSGLKHPICDRCKRKNRYVKAPLTEVLWEHEGKVVCNHYVHYKK